ncbi:hypothetical protein [Paraflavitalea speifideaquila]|uniref:hypothetical protein n=1 Tax=Paraflavitalea speifideaquila TaxID=3076558 RepID=UPI0028E2F85B|nr:hypothetical protein [Paraflavitalea speifideiaquila]
MLVFVCLSTIAQEPVAWKDSIQKVLLTHQADTARVNLLNKLAAHYIQTNLDSTAGIAGRAKALAKQLHYDQGIADATIQLAIASRNKGNYTAALEEFQQAINLYEQLKATSPRQEPIFRWPRYTRICRAITSPKNTWTKELPIACSRINYTGP